MRNNFVVPFANVQEYNALMQWAEKEGYGWQHGSVKANSKPEYGYDRQYPNICFSGDKYLTRGNDNMVGQNAKGPIVAFNAFAAIQGIELGPEPMEVVLTKDYKAVIDYVNETVTVGCQVIPFTKINEVYACTKKHQERPVLANAVPQSECDAALRNAVHYAMQNGATFSQKQAAVDYLKKYGFKVVKE